MPHLPSVRSGVLMRRAHRAHRRHHFPPRAAELGFQDGIYNLIWQYLYAT
jgi:hypothetical protein